MSEPFKIIINQSCAVLIDGNNIEMSLQSLVGNPNALVDFDKLIPKLLQNRGLSRLIYFREGVHISEKLAERLLNQFHGSVIPCHKSADIPLTIKATQIAQKVDTIIILSGDSDYVELVRHLRGEGVRVEIAAIRQTTAKILIDEADLFTPITEDDCYILKSYSSQSPQKNSSQPNTKTAVKNGSQKADESSSTPEKKVEKKTSSGRNKKTNARKTSEKVPTTKKRSVRKPAENKASSKKTATKKTPKKSTTIKNETGKQTTVAKPRRKKETGAKAPSKTTNSRRRTAVGNKNGL